MILNPDSSENFFIRHIAVMYIVHNTNYVCNFNKQKNKKKRQDEKPLSIVTANRLTSCAAS